MAATTTASAATTTSDHNAAGVPAITQGSAASTAQPFSFHLENDMDLNKIKLGKKVSFTRRNGEDAVGTIAGPVREEANGTWVDVNTGDKKKPKIAKVRPSKLSAA